METYDSPLSVYCGKGRVQHLRFESTASRISDHVGDALRRLGVSEVLATQIERQTEGADFATGFRFEEQDETIGQGELDRSEPQHPDASRVAVYITYLHAELERHIAQTLGPLQPYESFSGSEGEAQAVGSAESWRGS